MRGTGIFTVEIVEKEIPPTRRHWTSFSEGKTLR